MKKITVLIMVCFCLVFLNSFYASAEEMSIADLEAKYGGKIAVAPGYTGLISDDDLAIADSYLAQITRFEATDVSVAPMARRAELDEASGTASVWAGIPAIGHCYVNTRYHITFVHTSSGYNDIQTCTLQPSYMSGVSTASFAFTRNTWEKIGYSTARITAYGTLTYPIPGTSLIYTTGEQGVEADISVAGL